MTVDSLHNSISPFWTSIPGHTTVLAAPNPVIGQKQFDEMVMPRDVEKEDNFELIENERKFATELQTKLVSLNIPDAELLQLAQEITAFDIQNVNSLLLNRDLPYLAMEALRRGFLDPMHGPKQVATILNFWGALQYHGKENIQTIPLFQDNSANPLAISLIKETLSTFIVQTKASGTPFLEGAKLEQFLENMRKLPPSEQQFLLVPDVQDMPEQKTTISQAIQQATSVNVFSRLTSSSGQKMRMVPSMGMMQVFLDAQYDEPVTIYPRLYLSTEMHIRDCGLHGTRDMMVPFPDASGFNRCPKTADGFEAPWYDFTYHDFYHALTASAIPDKYRKAGIAAYDALASSENAGVRQIGNRLLDMEYDQFHHHIKRKGRPDTHTFWSTITKSITSQTQLYNSYQQLKDQKIESHYEAFAISSDDEVVAMKSIFKTLLFNKKGPKELTIESYQTFVNQAIDEATQKFIQETNENRALNGKEKIQASKTQYARLRKNFETLYNDQPIYIFGKLLN